MRTARPGPGREDARSDRPIEGAAREPTAHVGFDAMPAAERAMIQLQRTIGNRAVNRLLGRTTASGHGGMHEPASVPGGRTLTGSLPGLAPARRAERAHAAPGGGAPLPDPVRSQMERSYGADFSSVRIHHGGHANALAAEAYTQGNDVTFAVGRFDPSSTAGLTLIGHELAHVVQQRTGRVSSGQAKGAAINTALEVEADHAGARAAAGQPAGITGGSAAGPPVDRAVAPIQRKARWDESAKQEIVLDMAELIYERETTERKPPVGFCEPTVNDKRVLQVARENLLNLLEPPKITWTDEPESGSVTASVDEASENIGSYYMEIPDRTRNTWTKEVPGDVAKDMPVAHLKESVTFDANVTLRVDGSSEAFDKTILHEKVHREDHKRIFEDLIVPWNDGVDDKVGQTFTGDSREDVEKQLYGEKLPAEIAKDFVDATLVAGGKWHDHPAGKEAGINVVTVTPTLIHLRFEDNTPGLDAYVRDNYSVLWDEVKAVRGPALELREKRKKEEREYREQEAKRARETRDQKPQTTSAHKFGTAGTKFLNQLNSLGIRFLIKAKGGLGVLGLIVEHSAGDDGRDGSEFQGHAARYAVFILTQIKDEIERVLSETDDEDALAHLKKAIAPHRDKLQTRSTTTTDNCAAEIASVLGEIAGLLPPP